MPCITLAFDPAIGPLLNVIIAPAASIRTTATNPSHQHKFYPLLVDTGADTSCISPDIISELGLSPSGKVQVITPTGQASANQYLVDFGVSFSVASGPATVFAVENITVIEFNGTQTNYHGLIGRDMICRGQLTVTGYDKRFTFCL